MPEAVIVAAARSPIGRAYKGSLRDVRPDDLAATIVSAALEQVPEFDPDEVEDLMLGCGCPGGLQGFNMAKVVATLIGRDRIPGTTVTRYCSSSLQTARMAMHAIRSGEGDAFIAAGVESVSSYRGGNSDSPPPREGQDPRDKEGNPWLNARFTEARARTSARAAGPVGEWQDPRPGELPDIYISMGQTAENVAGFCQISRADQDEFALTSQQRARAAVDSGFFAREITPVLRPDGSVFDADESPRPQTTAAALAALNPVFRPDGTVTAGNACPLNDGAAALIVMSGTRASELGITPLARIVSTAVSGLSPEIMGLGPVEASQQALGRAGLKIGDIDLVEINEAFAAQVLASARALGIDPDRLNTHGGAIALGHPFGMTGARIAATLINGLRAVDGTFGLETMCVGGGQGMAMVLERLS